MKFTSCSLVDFLETILIISQSRVIKQVFAFDKSCERRYSRNNANRGISFRCGVEKAAQLNTTSV